MNKMFNNEVADKLSKIALALLMCLLLYVTFLGNVDNNTPEIVVEYVEVPYEPTVEELAFDEYLELKLLFTLNILSIHETINGTEDIIPSYEWDIKNPDSIQLELLYVDVYDFTNAASSIKENMRQLGLECPEFETMNDVLTNVMNVYIDSVGYLYEAWVIDAERYDELYPRAMESFDNALMELAKYQIAVDSYQINARNQIEGDEV